MVQKLHFFKKEKHFLNTVDIKHALKTHSAGFKKQASARWSYY